jgi:hypothetical protein
MSQRKLIRDMGEAIMETSRGSLLFGNVSGAFALAGLFVGAIKEMEEGDALGPIEVAASEYDLRLGLGGSAAAGALERAVKEVSLMVNGKPVARTVPEADFDKMLFDAGFQRYIMAANQGGAKGKKL